MQWMEKPQVKVKVNATYTETVEWIEGTFTKLYSYEGGFFLGRRVGVCHSYIWWV